MKRCLAVLEDRHIDDQHKLFIMKEVAKAWLIEKLKEFPHVTDKDIDDSYSAPGYIYILSTHDDGPRGYVKEIEVPIEEELG